MTTPLLKTTDVAERLNVTADQARKLIRLKAFPATNLNPHGITPNWRVEEADLEAYIQAGRTR